MNVSPSELAAQYRRAIAALPWMHDADRSYSLPPYTLAACGSREVDWDLEYLHGKVGDGGYAHGPWQLDLHPQNYTAEKKAACDRIDAGDMHVAAAWAGDELRGDLARCGSNVGMFNAYNCVDPATEILTIAGWKTHETLMVGNVVLTLNPESWCAEWQPVWAVNRFQVVDHPMVLMDGRRHSSLTTLDHRWPVERRSRTFVRRGVSTTSWLMPADAFILAAPLANGPREPKHSDAFVETVAWFWTEGTIRNAKRSPTVAIYQSYDVNPRYCDRIRNTLTSLFGPSVPPWSQRKQRGEGNRYNREAEPAWVENSWGDKTKAVFSLNHAASEPILTVAPAKRVRAEFLAELTQAQLLLFIEASLCADRTGPTSLAQSDRGRVEAFQIACVLAGFAANLTDESAAGMWSVTKSELRVTRPLAAARAKGRSLRYGPHPYTGTIWCPTTPNGTWFARRKGKTYFTGNSGHCGTAGTAGNDYGPDTEERRRWLLANFGPPPGPRQSEDDE